jgi:glutaminyl-tRNA synthetase
VRIYNPLFTRPDPGAGGDFLADLNPNSLEVLAEARLELELAKVKPGDVVQFERQGYFCADSDSTPGEPVFNRTVALRDSYAKA